MAGGFTGSARTVDGFYGPDSKLYPVKWWDDPVPPTNRQNISVRNVLLSQIDESEPYGKQSCRLTSSLNALIVRESLAPAEAAVIQQEIASDEAFDGYWVPTDDGKFRGFTSNPHHFAFILERFFGKRIGVESIQSDNILPEVTRRLQSGLAVILEGHSDTGAHARMAYQPEGEEQFFLHDPKYLETSGQYDFERLGEFQDTSYVAAF